jgi:hypothetical protein
VLIIGENSVIGVINFANRDIPDDAVAFGVQVKKWK